MAKRQRQSVCAKVVDVTQVLQQLYSPASHFQFESFLKNRIDSQPDLRTFLRFVVYFLPQSSLSDITVSNPGILKVLKVLPSVRHWRELSLILHPDKNPLFRNLQTLLNEAWSI